MELSERREDGKVVGFDAQQTFGKSFRHRNDRLVLKSTFTEMTGNLPTVATIPQKSGTFLIYRCDRWKIHLNDRFFFHKKSTPPTQLFETLNNEIESHMIGSK
jgi:hypothetical protein